MDTHYTYGTNLQTGIASNIPTVNKPTDIHIILNFLRQSLHRQLSSSPGIQNTLVNGDVYRDIFRRLYNRSAHGIKGIRQK